MPIEAGSAALESFTSWSEVGSAAATTVLAMERTAEATGEEGGGKKEGENTDEAGYSSSRSA